MTTTTPRVDEVQQGLDGLFPEPLSDDAAVLSIRELEVVFGGIRAVDSLSLTVHHGELLAVIGPNGAGKTTLLNALCGVVRANTMGQIEILGNPIADQPPATIARLGVGRSFQHPPLLEHESALQNVLTGAHIATGYGLAAQVFTPRRVKRTERVMEERALKILDFMGLRDLANELISELPYGPRKMIDIARAMMSAPRVLMLDEPTSGLDSAEQQKVAELLIQLRESRRLTLLLVEHHMDIVRSVASRVVGLQAGSVLAEGEPAEVLDSEAFRAAIIGGEDETR